MCGLGWARVGLVGLGRFVRKGLGKAVWGDVGAAQELTRKNNVKQTFDLQLLLLQKGIGPSYFGPASRQGLGTRDGCLL